MINNSTNTKEGRPPSFNFDYSLTPAERNKAVSEYLDNHPDPLSIPSYFLTCLADYILYQKFPKSQKKNIPPVVTANRQSNIINREISLEQIQQKCENNEYIIYNFITNDKNIIFMPKIKITQEDLDTIPTLKELRQEIEKIEKKLENTPPGSRRRLFNQLVEMRKDQYILKMAYHKPVTMMKAATVLHQIQINEKIEFDKEGVPQPVEDSISLLNPNHVSLLLCNYGKIKDNSWGNFESDSYYLIIDLENLIDSYLKTDYPILFDLLVDKIDGLSNEQIQKNIFNKYEKKYSESYISKLWRQRIPALLAEKAQNDYLEWHYTEIEKGSWKRCSKCKEYKLLHPRFYSKNKSAKSGFYSICKECRRKKS